ncbi:HAD-like protein [Xylaria intraflava]|nr:HAD-like protein [Xylaria intraflava]
MNPFQIRPRAIIFDLGDVLFTWSAKTTTVIPSRRLKDILSTPIWNRYECGEITRHACYELSGEQFSIPVSEITEAFAQAHQSLRPDHEVVSFLRGLKKDDSIKIYAMSNIGKEDFDDLATKVEWSLFDRVFTSAAAGMRKPDLRFYRHVLDQIDLFGSQTVFVDDKRENVHVARTLGIHGLVFGPTTVQTLHEIFNSPIGRGWKYLLQNVPKFESVTNTGVSFVENFSKLFIADLLQDRTLTDLTWGAKNSWNFFSDEAVLVPGGHFPDDLDTTCLALKVLRPSMEIVSPMLETMMGYVNGDGTVQTYYDRKKVRADPIVSANVLACFYSYNRGHELERTLQVVRSMLANRSYLQGTRYYPSPDCCLGFIGRLAQSSGDARLHDTLDSLLRSRLRERVGLGGSALDLAMRIITCSQMGIPCGEDRRTLLDLQCEDGAWEGGWLYRYGSSGILIQNRGVTTAMAVAALSS